MGNHPSQDQQTSSKTSPKKLKTPAYNFNFTNELSSVKVTAPAAEKSVNTPEIKPVLPKKEPINFSFSGLQKDITDATIKEPKPFPFFEKMNNKQFEKLNTEKNLSSIFTFPKAKVLSDNTLSPRPPPLSKRAAVPVKHRRSDRRLHDPRLTCPEWAINPPHSKTMVLPPSISTDNIDDALPKVKNLVATESTDSIDGINPSVSTSETKPKPAENLKFDTKISITNQLPTNTDSPKITPSYIKSLSAEEQKRVLAEALKKEILPLSIKYADRIISCWLKRKNDDNPSGLPTIDNLDLVELLNSPVRLKARVFQAIQALKFYDERGTLSQTKAGVTKETAKKKVTLNTTSATVPAVTLSPEEDLRKKKLLENISKIKSVLPTNKTTRRERMLASNGQEACFFCQYEFEYKDRRPKKKKVKQTFAAKKKQEEMHVRRISVDYNQPGDEVTITEKIPHL